MADTAVALASANVEFVAKSMVNRMIKVGIQRPLGVGAGVLNMLVLSIKPRF